MMAIASNISGLFSLLGEVLELYKDYTSRMNRAEPLTILAVLMVVMLGLTVKYVHAHSNIMQYYDYC